MSTVMEKARILLVDEDKLFRMKVRHTLEQEAGMEIVGECTSAEEALPKMGALFPDIILMDNCLPGINGIEACRNLTENSNTCNVIIFSEEQELVSYALSAGATFCFPKDLALKELATAVTLTRKWQLLKAKNDDNSYSIRQIEAMMMGHRTKFTTLEETKDEAAWLPPKNEDSNIIREVTLVIPVPDEVAQLRRFICRVEGTLQADILETVGSWSGTHLTLVLRRPASLAKMLDKLMKMPEVAEVAEKLAIRDGRFNFFKKIKPVSRQEISVTLSPQVQLSTVVEQEHQYLDVPQLQPQPVGALVS